MTAPDTSPAVQGVTAEEVEAAAKALYDESDWAGSVMIGPNDFLPDAKAALEAAAQVRAGQDGEVARLKRQVEHLSESRNRYATLYGDAEKSRHVAQEANERLRSVLRQCESEGRTMSGAACCPICHGLMRWGEFAFPKPPIGHAPDCALAAALLADPATDTGGQP